MGFSFHYSLSYKLGHLLVCKSKNFLSWVYQLMIQFIVLSSFFLQDYNKNAGFIVLLTSIFALFFFGEIRNLTTFTRLNNNGFSLSFFFLSFLSFPWIGAQFPGNQFLSYARILTLDYYFLLMCILFPK